MPSPSASDGGSDNTSVAAAAVWMRMLAGMLPPKMLSTAAAAGRGAQVAAQDQRAPSGRRRLSQLRSRHSTWHSNPCACPPSPDHSSPLQRGRVSFGEYISERKPPEVLPAEQLGGARVLRTQLQRVPRRGDGADAHADAHAEAQCRAGAHMVII